MVGQLQWIFTLNKLKTWACWGILFLPELYKHSLYPPQPESYIVQSFPPGENTANVMFMASLRRVIKYFKGPFTCVYVMRPQQTHKDHTLLEAASGLRQHQGQEGRVWRSQAINLWSCWSWCTYSLRQVPPSMSSFMQRTSDKIAKRFDTN